MKHKTPSRFSFKSIARGSVLPASTLLLALAASNANAQSLYFVGPSPIANNGSYSWDGSTSWGAASTTTPGTGGSWVQGDFARFYGGSGDSYTVTVNADEQNTGLYNNSTSTLTINSAGPGDDLDVITAVQGFLVASGGSLIINSPIVGNGGVAPELTGSLSLFGVNTYSGGTALGDSGNTLAYFNNNSSFGSGPITLNRTGIANFSTLLSSGGAAITLPNNFSTVAANTGTGTGLNFASAANTPVISTGSWTLGSVGLALRNNGSSTAPLTLSGGISGTGNIIFSGANGSTTYVSGSSANNSGFTGTATIGGGTGENAITVSLGAPNTLSSMTGVSLAGGTLTAGGYSQAFASSPLTLAAASSLMFGATAGVSMSFANSSAAAWSGVLNLADWQGNSVADGGTSSDTLQFGSSLAALTSAQLADIEVDGNAATLGEVKLDANGFVEVVPEPSTVVLGLISGITVIARLRRRTT